jgi:hypothetical protein
MHNIEVSKCWYTRVTGVVTTPIVRDPLSVPALYMAREIAERMHTQVMMAITTLRIFLREGREYLAGTLVSIWGALAGPTYDLPLGTIPPTHVSYYAAPH